MGKVGGESLYFQPRDSQIAMEDSIQGIFWGIVTSSSAPMETSAAPPMGITAAIATSAPPRGERDLSRAATFRKV